MLSAFSRSRRSLSRSDRSGPTPPSRRPSAITAFPPSTTTRSSSPPKGTSGRSASTAASAQRLTTHPSEESRPAFSPDGKTIAFSAAYEGPTEVYTLPLEGGVPVRQTFDGADGAGGRVDAGRRGPLRHPPLLDAARTRSSRASTPRTGAARARSARPGERRHATTPSGRTLFFTRLAFQGSYTKRYQGGTAQNIWRFAGRRHGSRAAHRRLQGHEQEPDALERPRLLPVSDRDGHDEPVVDERDAAGTSGSTRGTTGFDAQSPSLSNGRIAYQLGADIRMFDIEAQPGPCRADPARLGLRPAARALGQDADGVGRHARTSPPPATASCSTRAASCSSRRRSRDGSSKPRATRRSATARARFFPDGKTLLTLGDASGEVEFWRVPANGVGEPRSSPATAKVLRWDGHPVARRHAASRTSTRTSSSGSTSVASKQQKQVAKSDEGGFADVHVVARRQVARLYVRRTRTRWRACICTSVETRADRRRSRPIGTTATRRSSARTASGSTSSRTATSCRSSAARGARASRSRSSTSRPRSSTSR